MKFIGFIYRDLFRGWGAQEFPTPEVDFPSLEFLRCTQRIVLKYWNMSGFPLLKNRQLIVLYLPQLIPNLVKPSEGLLTQKADLPFT